MSSRPRRLNSLARRQRMCPNTNPGSRPCSHLQVDIPERDALGNEPSRPKTGQPVGWTTTTLLASLAAIAGSSQGGDSGEARNLAGEHVKARAPQPVAPQLVMEKICGGMNSRR